MKYCVATNGVYNGEEYNDWTLTFDNIDQALACMDVARERGLDHRLFEIGREVPVALHEEIHYSPGETTVVQRYRVKE